MSTFLPIVSWPAVPLPVVPRDTLNRSASDPQEQIAAENEPLPIIYGQPRVAPRIANVLPHSSGAVIQGLWSHGECDSIVSMSLNDVDLGPGTSFVFSDHIKTVWGNGVEAYFYPGTPTQAVNAMLVTAFAAQGITFTDALPNICYSVVYVPSSASSVFPRLHAIGKWLKVYDPRQDSTNGGTGAQRFATPSTWEWSDNPSVCTANFVTNAVYGCKRTVNWPSVIAVANDCDALAGGTEKMRTLNLSLETVQPVTDWLETLRTYAGCWINTSGPDYKFVSDKAGSSVASISHASGQVHSIANVKKRGVQSTPTVMIVEYKDTTTLPHKTGMAVVYAPGVLAGTTPRRESKVSLLGIDRHSQAVREATERLNKLLLNDLSLNLGVYDERLDLEVGDIIDVTHPVGLTAKLLRVMVITGEYGRFALALIEYDPAVYSSVVTAAPTSLDTTMPDPLGAVAAPTGPLTITERLYETRDKSYASKLAISWTNAVDFYPLKHFVVISDTTHVVNSGDAVDGAYTFGPLMDGVTYTVDVYAERESTHVRSAALSGTKATVGKAAKPSNITGFVLTPTSTGSTLTWTAPDDVDLAGVSLQMTSTWNDALPTPPHKITHVDFEAFANPATYGFSIKAVDFSGNVSVTAASLTLNAVAPATPVLAATAYYNAVVLSWNDCRTTNPLVQYEIEVKKDAVLLANRVVLGSLRGVTYFETASGTYTYQIVARDAYIPGLPSNIPSVAVVATGIAGAVSVADAASDATTWPMLARSQTGDQTPTTDSGLSYNATTKALTATTFVGALSGAAASVAAALTFAVSGGAAAGTTFNGSVARTIDYSTVGAQVAGSYYSPGSNAAFGTLSASSTVSGLGFSTYLASPPAIGDTTPNAAHFTTLLVNNAASFGSTLGVTGAVTAASFSGAGTGLTGTAASLSIGGTATVATFLNGGSSSEAAGDITNRVSSGFWQNSAPTTATGWPIDSSWFHLLTTTHSNTANYFSMQLAASFFGQQLYYRSTNNSGTTAWSTIWTSSSLTNLNQLTNGPGYYASGSNASFGTLTASSTVSGAGFSAYMNSPPTIGDTVPNAAHFTTLAVNNAALFGSTVGVTGAVTAASFSGAGTGLTGTAASLTAGTATNVAYSGLTGTVPTWNQSTTGAATGGASGAIAATTLSASSTVSGLGFSTYLASPPAIGDTTPNAAHFTTLLVNNAASFGSTLGVTGAVTAASFSGAGTGLTGTAAGLNIGGGALTASFERQMAASAGDCNTLFRETPVYCRSHQEGNSWTNTPVAGNWFFVDSIRHSNATNYWGTQLAYGWEAMANRMWMRNVSANVFSAWTEFITSGNIAAQSVATATIASTLEHAYTAGGDLNSSNTFRIVSGDGMTGAPDASWHRYLQVNDGVWGWQLGASYWGGLLKFRFRDNGAWQTWKTVAYTDSSITGAATGGASGAIAATTLSASSTVSGLGFSTYLASPPAIGDTTPNAAHFTTLLVNNAASFGSTLSAGATTVTTLASGAHTITGFLNIGNSDPTDAINIGTFGHKIRRNPSDGALWVGGGQATIELLNATNITGALGVNSQLTINAANYNRVLHQISGTTYWSVGQRTDNDYYIYREAGAGKVVINSGNLYMAGGLLDFSQRYQDSASSGDFLRYASASPRILALGAGSDGGMYIGANCCSVGSSQFQRGDTGINAALWYFAYDGALYHRTTGGGTGNISWNNNYALIDSSLNLTIKGGATITNGVSAASFSGAGTGLTGTAASLTAGSTTNVLSGNSTTWTPTVTASTNVASTANGTGCYMRINNAVTAQVHFDASYTTAATLSTIYVSLPVNVVSVTNLRLAGGGGSRLGATTIDPVYVELDGANQRIKIILKPADTANSYHSLTFTYFLIN